MSDSVTDLNCKALFSLENKPHRFNNLFIILSGCSVEFGVVDSPIHVLILLLASLF